MKAMWNVECGIGNLKKIDEQQNDERDSQKELEN